MMGYLVPGPPLMLHEVLAKTSRDCFLACAFAGGFTPESLGIACLTIPGESLVRAFDLFDESSLHAANKARTKKIPSADFFI